MTAPRSTLERFRRLQRELQSYKESDCADLTPAGAAKMLRSVGRDLQVIVDELDRRLNGLRATIAEIGLGESE